jgi:hypothetical protein
MPGALSMLGAGRIGDPRLGRTLLLPALQPAAANTKIASAEKTAPALAAARRP